MRQSCSDDAKSVVIAGSYGLINIGDEAILTATIEGIARRRPAARFSVLSLTPRISGPEHPSVRVVRSGAFRGLLGTWRAIGQADLLFVGGGSIIQDATTLSNLLFHLSRVAMACVRGRPFALCGIGIGPIRSRLGRWLTGRLLRRARGIYVRDQYSRATAMELGLDGSLVQEAGDLALTLKFPDRGELQESYGRLLRLKRQGGPLVGLSVRTLGRDRHMKSDWSRQFYGRLDIVAHWADELIDKLDATVVFTSMHPGQDDPVFPEFCRRLRRPERAFLLPGSAGPKTFLAALGLLDMHVGMRLHSLILAARSAVPFVALAYDPKVVGFCRQLGLEEQVLPMEQFSLERLRELVDETWRRRDHIRDAIRHRLPQMQARAEHSIDAIADLLADEPSGAAAAAGGTEVTAR